MRRVVAAWWIAGIVGLSAGAATADHHRRRAATARPRPGTPITVEAVGWPAGTTTVELGAVARVYREPAGRGGKLGKIAKGTRVAFRGLAAGRSSCPVWLELEPAGTGWMCGADAEPTDQPPFAVAHPGDNPHHRGPVVPPPSTFAGLDLTTAAPPWWPFAWLVPGSDRPGAVIKTYVTPRGTAVGTAEPRSIVPVLQERDGYLQIAVAPERWVRDDDARVARIAPRPSGIRDDERWLDVDIDQQVLVGYSGRTPVYATLVSTGSHVSGTPTGVYRIAAKTARTTMSNPAGTILSWLVRDVPWAMSFRKYFALHGVYWHDEFGHKHSHGCINLAPADARWAYAWTLPAVPDGWVEVKAEAGTGTAIRLRNHHHPDPPWLDFEGKPPELNTGGAITASREARRRRAR